MAILKDLKDQTSKILNNVTGSIDELTSLATNSATSAGSMVIIKGKIENEKAKLKKLYTELGSFVYNHPGEDYTDIVEKIKPVKEKLDLLETSFNSLKDTVNSNTKEIKDKVTKDIETISDDTKEDIKEETQEIKDFILKETEKLDKKIDEKIEAIQNASKKEEK